MVDFEDDIKNCVSTLSAGGTLLYPTETVWGLGCDATNASAIQKVYEIKGRPREKSFIILLADARELLRYVAAPPPDILEVVEGFEEPTTVIYEHGLDLPENLLHASGSLAIRVTTDPFCKALIKRYQKPIVSTSANLSGQPSAPIYSAVDPLIVQRADYVVRYRQDDHTIRKPSRLVRLHDDGHIEIIRS